MQCFCWAWEAYNVAQLSNGIPICVDILGYNLLANIQKMKTGEGFPIRLLSREGKGLLVCMRKCLVEKGYIPSVFFGLLMKVSKW